MAYGCYVSSDWIKVKAHLVEAQVAKSEYVDMDRHTKIYFGPEVKYRYAYNGEQFLGERYSWTVVYDKSERLLAAQRLVESYQTQSPITVFINPDAPRESVIERCESRSYLQLLVICAILLVITLSVFWIVRKN